MSFDFRDLNVYKYSKLFHQEIKKILIETKANRFISDQLRRASLSIVLNIAEGYGRFHKKDKRNFYVNARASVNECVACLDILFDENVPDEYLSKTVEIAKMLSGLIKKFSD